MKSGKKSKEINALIKAKEKLEETINAITKLENTEHIQDQLFSVRNQLKGIDELKRTGMKFKRLSMRAEECKLLDFN